MPKRALPSARCVESHPKGKWVILGLLTWALRGAVGWLELRS